GIRDFHVTGVQTCALPIFATDAGAPAHGPRAGADVDEVQARRTAFGECDGDRQRLLAERRAVERNHDRAVHGRHRPFYVRVAVLRSRSALLRVRIPASAYAGE